MRAGEARKHPSPKQSGKGATIFGSTTKNLVEGGRGVREKSDEGVWPKKPGEGSRKKSFISGTQGRTSSLRRKGGTEKLEGGGVGGRRK